MNGLLEANTEATVQCAVDQGENVLDAGEIPAFLERQDPKDTVLEVLDEKEESFIQFPEDVS